MNAFTYYMPAKVLFGKDCVRNFVRLAKRLLFLREDARQN